MIGHYSAMMKETCGKSIKASVIDRCPPRRLRGQKVRRNMKEYSVSYYLDNMYHTYLVDAHHEAEAYEKVLKGIPDECKPIMHDLKIERYYRKW